MVFNSFINEMVLPFLLVFVLVFAILQKSKILGDGKSQIDAMVSLAIGLILIGAPTSRDIVVNLMPWLAVGIAVILVFLILYGFVAGDLSGKGTSQKMKTVFASIAGIFTVGVVLYVTGLGSLISNWFGGAESNDLFFNLIIVVLVIVAMAVAVRGNGKASSDDSE